MKKYSIEQVFRASLAHVISSQKRGFQSRLAERAKIKASQISDFLAERRGISEDRRRDLVAILIETQQWSGSYDNFLTFGQHLLDGGTEKSWQLVQEPVSNIEPTLSNEKTSKVPLISWVRAGAFCEVEDPIQPSDTEEWVTCFSNVSENAFALTIQGDSMEPEFVAGDRVIVDPAIQPETGKFVVAKIDSSTGTNGEATFKQFIRDGEHVYLKPLNSLYPMMDMTGKQFYICGCVVEKNKRY